MRTRRQNIQLELALEPAAKGEARSAGAQGTEARTARAEPERPAAGQQPLMEAVVEPGNLKKALARVRRNKGAPGVDGMTVDELGDHLKAHWPEIRSRLLAGSYTPQPRCGVRGTWTMQRLSAILVRPESDSASACLRAGRPGFKVRDPGPQLGAQLGDLCREPRIEVRNLGPHLGEAGPELIGGNVVALFEAAVMDQLGDDFELVAVDAAGGELLGDGERVEHTGGSLPCARHGAKQPLPSIDSGRLRGEADPA